MQSVLVCLSNWWDMEWVRVLGVGGSVIDVGVELLHHEDQDDILSPRVYRMIVLYLHVLGCTVRVLYRGLRVSEANLL